MIDIDYFKRFNDTYGHTAGDDCLMQVAMALSAAARRNADKVSRIGGEEFAVILPDTDAEGVKYVSERLRDAVGCLCIPHKGIGQDEHVTVSIGSSTLIPGTGVNRRMLYEAADAGLYHAKGLGRNGTGHRPVVSDGTFSQMTETCPSV